MGTKDANRLQNLQNSAEKVRREKPDCSRCIKDRFKCDGYEPPQTWLFEPSRKIRKVESCEREARTCFDQAETESQQTDTKALLIHRPPRLHSFLLEPSSPWTPPLDQTYTQYFLLKTAPLLSSTRRWQYFWHALVPQAAWSNPSVHHAMIAMALTFDTYASGTDHTEAILSRRTQAIRAFKGQPASSWEVGLIICRLFSSMAQCNEDFASALTHMKSGDKILREATRTGCYHGDSDVVRLMAATFSGLLADSNNDLHVMNRFTPGKRSVAFALRNICAEYARTLRRITVPHHGEIETVTLGFLSVAFSTLNQAVSSALYPDVLVFEAEDGIVPVQEVRTQLAEENSILSLDDLTSMYQPLFHELQEYFDAPPSANGTTSTTPLSDLKHRLKLLVDNFVLQAHALEPRSSAGTFWLPDDLVPGCLMDRHLDRAQIGVSPCLGQVCRRGHGGQDRDGDVMMRERREYYHEFVCQYRSGFMC